MTVLLYADDVAILAPSSEGLRRLFGAFSTFCSAEHLTISEKKTKVLISSPSWSSACFVAGAYSFEVVPAFRYLGITIDTTASPARMR